MKIGLSAYQFSKYNCPVILRARNLETLEGLLQRHPVVGILGARQVGKTTLARQLAARREEPVTNFDLEDPEDLIRLTEPMQALQRPSPRILTITMRSSRRRGSKPDHGRNRARRHRDPLLIKGRGRK